MNLKLKPVLIGVLLATGTPMSVGADTLKEAFSDGKAEIDIRMRYEGVDDGNPATQDADASTMRTRLGFTSANYYNIQAHADFEVTHTGGDFNSLTNGKSDYAVVADPKLEDLNQVWFAYTGLENNTFKLGRQRVILDNARFVGNVGWRQNEQTFDALAYINSSFDDVSILLANVAQVNTILGGSVNTNTNLFNIGIDKTAIGKITAYAYSIDLDNSSANDTLTLGARLKGSASNFLYTVEYAQQSDTADNTNNLSAAYTFLEAGYKIGETKIFIADEILGSDGGNAGFQTLLATKHAFNGWADKFLTTPDDGLNDLYIKAVTKLAGLKLVGVYHDFSSDNGSISYGTELDLLVVKPIDKNMKALIKYSDYSADAYSTDTQKIWLSFEMKFSQ